MLLWPKCVTLEDHKDKFQNNPKCRLVNPSKSEVGCISKAYLSNIISTLAGKIGSNQWRKTPQVINLFKKLAHENNRRFIKFDISDFYLAISQDPLSRAFIYSRTIIADKVTAIKLARRNLSQERWKSIVWCNNGKLWWGRNFWGSRNLSAGKFLSPLLGEENFVLYTDDGLATVNSSSGAVLDRMKKNFISIFKNEALAVTIEKILIETDFLDVTFNILTKKCFRFRKVSNKCNSL